MGVDFRPYLLTTIRNTGISWRRRDSAVSLVAEVPDLVPHGGSDEPVGSRMHATVAADAFASLPERWRTVLWRTEIEGRSPAEIAPDFDMTPNGVAALAYRAREGLRQAYLDQHVPDVRRRNCRMVSGQLARWVRDGISDHKADRITAHLDRCADCRELATGLRELNEELPAGIAPLILGVQDLLAPQAYLNIVQFVDRRIFRMGIVISALMVILAVVFLMVARRWVGLKDYASLSYTVVERRRLTRWKQAGAVGFLSMLMLLSFIPYAGVALASFSKGWSLTPLPLSYTLQHYERVIVETPKYILNSFLYSGLAVALCIVVGVPIAWVLARSRLPGRGALDSINTLILAVPGTAIGIAYIRAFHFDLPGFDRGLTSFWIIMPIVLAVRRLPYTVRAAHSSLLLVHRSMEEAAQSVGATGLRTIRDISLPLIWKGIVVGSLFSFMTSLQEASAVLFLALGGWEMITNGIFTFYIAGSSSEAAALGAILIAVAALSVLLINRLAAGRMGGVFG